MNQRPAGYESAALTTELLPQKENIWPEGTSYYSGGCWRNVKIFLDYIMQFGIETNKELYANTISIVYLHDESGGK